MKITGGQLWPAYWSGYEPCWDGPLGMYMWEGDSMGR